eukprot:1149939-Pelagomonas_calceolata.AAC.3
MDIHMPEMDGLEATRCIMQRFPQGMRPRIIALSADTLKALHDRYAKAPHTSSSASASVSGRRAGGVHRITALSADALKALHDRCAYGGGDLQTHSRCCMIGAPMGEGICKRTQGAA